jgi:hypothetical protein
VRARASCRNPEQSEGSQRVLAGLGGHVTVQILRRKEHGSRLRLPAPASLTPAKLLNLCNLRPNLAFIP